MAAHSTVRLLLCLSLLLFLVLSHSTLATASVPACTAIFTTPLTLLNSTTLTHLTEPIIKSAASSNVCPNIPVDTPTCCSADSDRQIESITHNLITFRNTVADIAPSALLQSLFNQPWLDLTSQHVQWRNLTAEQQWIVMQYVNIVTPLFNSATPCMNAVLTYIQGLLCLSCDVRAGEFYHDGRLKQDGRTCEYASDVCEPVVSSVVAALPTLLDLYIAFLLTIPTPLPPLASASLSQSYLLRAAMASGISASGLCHSAWMGLFTGRYHSMESCTEVVCALMDRGLDWDVRGWLGLTDSAEEAIQLRKMRNGAGVTIQPSSGGMGGGGHGGHRRLLSVVMDESDSTEQLAAVSSFNTFSSVVGGLWSRFHVLHSGIHGGEEMVDAPSTTPTALRVFPPAPADLHETTNGHLTSIHGDDGDTGTVYYPLWHVGCASLEQFGVLCPMINERSAGHDKAVFLTVVFVVALAVSCAMWAVYRQWVRSGGGGDGSEGVDGLLGVGKKVRTMKARLSRRLAQRSRPSAGTEEAEGILAE